MQYLSVASIPEFGDHNPQKMNNDTINYNLQHLSGWTRNFGSIKDIQVQGNLLYLIGGDKELFIVDISDSINPFVIGSYHNNSQALVSLLKANLLFITLQQDGFDVMNIQNKTKPIQISHFQSLGAINDICIVENTTYLAKGSTGFDIVNIDNITEPYYVKTIYDGGTSEKIVNKNDLLFIADGLDGLEVYNISDLESPVRVGNFTDGSECNDLFLSNDYAYILDDSNHMKVLNISNETDIQKLDEYSLDNPSNIIVNNNFAFLSTDNTISIVNCTDPNNISEINNYNATDRIRSMTLNENTLYLNTRDGIEIIQVESILSLNLVNRFGYGAINEVKLYDNYIYATMGEEGLAIIDARDPMSIQTISKYSTNGKVVDICKQNNFLFLAIENYGIEVIDIQNLEQPLKISEYLSDGEVKSISIKNNHIFLADGLEGLKLIDTSDPTQLHLIRQIITFYQLDAIKVNIYEDTIYVIGKGGGVFLIDYAEIINPGDEFDFKEIISASNPIDVAAQGDFVFISRSSDLLVFDTSDPNNEDPIHSITDGTYSDLTLRNNRLYASGGQLLQIFEISDIENIKRTEQQVNGSFIVDLAVENEYIIVSNVAQGDDILLFNHTIPKEKQLLLYILAPIVGVVFITITIFIVIRIKKKNKVLPKEIS
jgi:hypothetical protein